MNARADFVMILPVAAQVTPDAPLPPFRWTRCNLGLGDSEPFICLIDSTGQEWITHSVQDILVNIDHFPDERDRHRLLAGAALHYGFKDAWTLIVGRKAKAKRREVHDGD